MNVIIDRDGWREALLEMPRYDFYHTWDYHEVEANREGATPILFRAAIGRGVILLPFLLRRSSIAGQSVVDLVSVYGYAGILESDSGLLANAVDREVFWSSVEAEMRDREVVSVFGRLHPQLNRTAESYSRGDVVASGSVVGIDLFAPVSEQWSGYRRGHRRGIARLRREGWSCQQEGRRSLPVFIDCYEATMDRVSAVAGYYFDRAYYDAFLEARDFEVLVYVCRDSLGAPQCAGLFPRTPGFVSYHLGGTFPAALRDAPTRLMFDQVRVDHDAGQWAWFNLGGGLGGGEDSLFHFKRGFSKQVVPFHVWKWIVDRERYEALCKITGQRDSSYFPAYRG